MASATFTAADIRPLPGSVCRPFDAAGTGGVGDAVYIDGSGDAALGDADAAASAQVVGIVVSTHDGSLTFAAGDRLDVCISGVVSGFSSLTPGAWVYASLTAGDIEDTLIATAGDYIYILGRAISASEILVSPFTYDVDVLT